MRGQPMMRQPVTRNARNYMRDPRSTQRDINLEVQAVAAQGKPWAAMAEGAAKMAEVLVKADAEEEYTRHLSDFTMELDHQLNNMMSQQIAYEEPNWRVGGTETLLRPAHKTSYDSFSVVIDKNRNRHAKQMGRASRSAFMQRTESLVADAKIKAAAINRKQHISFLQGSLLRSLEGQTLKGVDELLNTDLARLIYSGKELESLRDREKRKLAINHFAVRLVQADDLDDLEGIEAVIEIGAEAGMQYDEDKENYEPVINQFWKYLTGQDKLDFDAKINSKKDRLVKEEKAERKEFLDDLVGQIHLIPNDQKWTTDYFGNLLRAGKIDEDDIKRLIDQVKIAKAHRLYPTLESDGIIVNKIIDNIGDPENTVEFIRGQFSLTETDRDTLVKARQEYERKAYDWKSRSNPNGTEGWEAWQLIKRAFIPEPEFLAILPGAKQAEMLNAMALKQTELERHVREWRDNGVDDRQILEKALQYANQVFDERIKERTATSALPNDNTTVGLPTDFNGSEAMFDSYLEWGRKNSRLNNNEPLTYESVMGMPPGKGRDVLAGQLRDFGWAISPGFIGERTKVQELIDKAEERGDDIEVLLRTQYPWLFQLLPSIVNEKNLF